LLASTPAGEAAKMRNRFIILALTLGVFALNQSDGQQAATPIILQAATPAAAAAPPNPPTANRTANDQSVEQLLNEMRAANAETIKKQEAALETLDELQKAAEEIKIYSKRG